ncbi:MAG: T9SS type A sorting domain-containing protein [Candidatus Cloacimonetes bacterium]|nr:T9SS type A sorting domain-containing protein [Candidatus Cloacimonadota bacterium]
MRKTILILIIALGLSMASAIMVETASFKNFLYGTEPACDYDNWISHIAEGIAIPNYNIYAPYDRQTNGFGDYKTITSSQTVQWKNLIDLFLAQEWDEAETLIQSAGFPYQLVQFNDTDTGRTYYMLREIPDMSYYDDNGTPDDTYDDEIGAFDWGWGLYVFNPDATRPIIITTPHPCDDFDTPAMSAFGLEVWDARFMIISGTGREVKWTNVGSYTNAKSLSDPTRVANHPFNYAYYKFVDQIRDLYGQREFSIQIHSYDWNRHVGYPNCQISAGNARLCPNLPIRDLSDLRNDMLHQAPYLVIPANTIGIHGDVFLNDFYSVYYNIHDFIWTDGEHEVVVNDAIDLPGYANSQQMNYTLSGWNDYDSYDPFFHIEMDELPNCYEQTENNYHWFFGWDEATQRWDFDNLFTRFMQYYSPWIYHLEAVLDDLFEMNDGVPPTTPTNLTVHNVYQNKVDLSWEKSSAYDFETYEILYATEPIGTDNYQIFSRNNNQTLASQAIESVTVTGLNHLNTYYFAIRAKDKNDEYSGLSNEVTTELGPANIASFAAYGMEQSIRLYWVLSSQEFNQGFKVYRKQGDGFFELVDSWQSNPGLASSAGNVIEWWDVELVNGVKYTYQISATNMLGNEFFYNYPASATAMPVQAINIVNQAGTLTDSITFGNNDYATDDRDDYWDITKSNPSGSYVWNAFWQANWGNNGTSLQQEIKGGYDVDNEVKTWVMRTRCSQTGNVTLSATGTFGRAEKLWLQDGGQYHNLLSGPYTFNNTSSNVRTFNVYWGNLQPKVLIGNMANQVVQGGDTVQFAWTYQYPFLIDYMELSLQNEDETLILSDYLTSSQSTISFQLPQSVDIPRAKLVFEVVAIDGVRSVFESDWTLAVVPKMNLAMFESGWQMVSNPWPTEYFDVQSVFGAGTESFVQNTSGGWMPNNDFYFGIGTWVNPSDVTFLSSAESVVGNDYYFDLEDGWNLIPNPHICEYQLSELRFFVNGKLFSFGEMLGQELVSPAVWVYQNGRYELAQKIMPYQAFLIRYYGSSDIFTQINLLPYWESTPITTPAAQSSVEFRITSNGMTDAVRVGTHKLAQGESLFRLDLPKPPAPPFEAPRIHLFVTTPTKHEFYTDYYSLYHPLIDSNGEEEKILVFQTLVDVPNLEPITFSWGESGLPEGWQAAFWIDNMMSYMGSDNNVIWTPQYVAEYTGFIRLSNYEVSNDNNVAQAINDVFAYPNPFNPNVNIAFHLANPSAVKVNIYNIRGQKVATLHDGNMTSGSQVLHWNGRDAGGRSVASGMYLARIETGKSVKTLKLMLMK